MPPPARRTQALTCARGHYGWTDWEVVSLGVGYGVRAHCELGDHWLAPGIALDPAIVSSQQPFAWVSQQQADWALTTWAEQSGERHE